MMDPIDPRKRSLPGKKEHKPLTSTLPPRHKRGEEFLKGPIPWNWLCRAAELCGKAFQVAIAIWFLAGVHKREVEVSGQAVEDLGVSRYACYRGLKLLEKAGLISVHRAPGRKAIVTILDFTEGINQGSDTGSLGVNN
jgi:DNA-directed RNA polymerase subunit N (RpoN/RPB10)